MNRTTVVGSVHAIEKDGQATVCQQPQGAGGGPKYESFADFDGLGTFENIKPAPL